MSDKQTITYKIKNQDIELNTYQAELLKQLQDGAPKNFLFKNYFIKKQKGAYLYGKVGRGKTLLMDIFLDGLNISYKKFHYIDLMQEIHKLLEKEKGTKNPIKKIFDKYFSNFRLIFIDEFQVEDIADAMILGDLLMYAIKNNTYLYFTSNAKPSELYKNGLQRQKFIPCIDLIEANTNVMSLKGGFDYRSRNIAEIKESFFETSDDINEFLRLAVLFQMSLFGFLLKIFSLNPLAQRITLKSVWTVSGFLLMILISVTMIIMML
jgi:cell division protein ZapE